MDKMVRGGQAAAAARVVALFVAANGRADPREIAILDELGAFERLGVTRERFLDLVDECLEQVGYGLSGCSWLHERDQNYVDGLLDEVADPADRLSVCRLGAAILTADGRVTGDERLIYGHALARWHVSQAQVTQAILDDGNRHPQAPRSAAAA